MMAASNACARRRRRNARDARVIEPLASGRRPDAIHRTSARGRILPRPSSAPGFDIPGTAMASVDDDAHRGRPATRRAIGRFPASGGIRKSVRVAPLDVASARGRGSTRELLRPGARSTLSAVAPHPILVLRITMEAARTSDGVCARPGSRTSRSDGVPGVWNQTLRLVPR